MRATRWSIVALLLFAWGLTLGMSGVASAQSYDAEETRFLELINAYRQENGLEPLLLSAPLSVASERHSEDMGTYGFFSHTSVQSSYYPAGSGLAERLAQEGYDYNTYTSENVAYGQATAEEVFEAWRVSPGHNINMLGDYKVIGIGLSTVGGTPYWTTDFGAYVDPSAGGRATNAPQDAPATSEASGGKAERLATPDAVSNRDATARTDDAQYANAGADDAQYASAGTDDAQYANAEADDSQYASPVAASAPAAASVPATDAPATVPASDAAAATRTPAEAPAEVPTETDTNSGTRGNSGATGGGAAAAMGMTTLPDTGGLSPVLLAAGLLLVSGGLLLARNPR